MIRINLLPVKETQQQIKGRQQLLLFVALFVLEAAVLFYFTQDKQKSLDDLKSENAQREAQNDLEPPKNIDALKKQESALKEQQRVLQRLTENQIGPVKMLNALSMITTPLTDPVQKVAVKSWGWNPDWDARRLWITSFVEVDRRVKLSGYARSNNDVAEFYRRLNNNNHFVAFELEFTEQAKLPNMNDVELVHFTLDGLALYGPADERRFFGDRMPKAAAKAPAKPKKG